MALDIERLCSVIESLLLIAPEPVPVARLIEVIRIEDPDTSEEDVRAAAAGLVNAYAETGQPPRPVSDGGTPNGAATHDEAPADGLEGEGSEAAAKRDESEETEGSTGLPSEGAGLERVVEADAEEIPPLLSQGEGGLIARGFRVEEVGGGLQLRTVAQNAAFVRRYLAAKPQRLSKAALETLSIVAYRQPVTKPDIEGIRGVDAGASLRGLLDRDLIKIVGKKDEVGRPLLYGTTQFFLEFFSLKALSELPTLREFHELDEASLEEVSALDDAPSVKDLAEAAQFLVQREDDPDLAALDQAVKAADAAKAAAEEALSAATAPPPDQEPTDAGPAGGGGKTPKS